MNLNDSAPEATSHLAIMRGRCRQLGLPLLRFDANGSFVAAEPTGDPLERWASSATVLGALRGVVENWKSQASPALECAGPGLWAAPLVEMHRRKRAGYLVALLMGPEILSDPLAERGLDEIGGDREPLRAEITARAVHNGGSAQRLAACLSWSHTDLESSSMRALELSSFGRQLTESYEEISLLYKLAQSMNQLVHPQKFVSLACDELHKTLAYSWIAVRFVNDRKIARGMAGRVIWRGEKPCAGEAFESETSHVLGTLEPGSARVLSAGQRGTLGRGASQLLVHPVTRDGRVAAAIFAGSKRGDDPQVSSTDMKLIDAAAGAMSILLDNAILYDDQQLMFVGTLEALTASIDAKDPYTCGHSQRVAELAALLAAAHGVDEEQVERIRIAGIVHDVGKIGVPESVLCKAGRLTDTEFALIKQHPEIGYQILKDIPLFDDLLPGVLHHHERYDGRGYPRGLVARDIPLMARIIGLVDAFDAMSSNRTYRAAMPRERVLEELRDHALTQFDPDLVVSFMKVDLSTYDQLVEKHQFESASGGLRIRRTGIAA